MEKANKLLHAIGINPERLRLEWVSAAEGAKFAGVLKEFTELLERLGPFKRETQGIPNQ